MSNIPELKTERLALRDLKESDVNEIYLLRSDDTVNSFVDRERAKGPEDALAFIKKISFLTQSKQSFYWAVSKKENEPLIGTITLWNFNEEKNKAELGYELLPQYHGQGFMNEALKTVIEFAFSTLRLSLIEGWTHPHNSASIKVLDMLGFKRDQEAEKYRPADAIELIYTLSNTNQPLRG